jgi:hypothetical protein
MTPPAAKTERGEGGGAGSTPVEPKSVKPKKAKRGRPKETNPKEDKRIYDAWKTRTYKTYAECAQAVGKSGRETYLAVERHRARLKRSACKR